MVDIELITLFLFLLLINIIHIFEEIFMEAYKVSPKATLLKYLIGASIIVTINMLIFLAILHDTTYGLQFGIFSAVFAILNGIIHTIGFLMTKKVKGTLGAGFFTGIPLGIFGFMVLLRIIILL